MALHLLTDRTVKAARGREKPYRLPDGGNLYLYVASTGIKSWQFRYRLEGKTHTFTIGKYPKISLERARIDAERARGEVEAGHHLTARKRAAKLTEAGRQAVSAQIAAMVDQGMRASEARQMRDLRQGGPVARMVGRA